MNIHLTAEFERALKRLMRLRKLTSKSEAVRIAVEEAAERAARRTQTIDFASLRGSGLGASLNPTRRFATEDDLWE